MRLIVIAILLLPFRLLLAQDPQLPYNNLANKTDKPVKSIEYSSDGIFKNMILFDYDINNNITEKTYMKSYVDTPGVWINLFRHQYQYDANNNLTSDIRQDFRNGDWSNTGREYNEWDDKGNLLVSGNMYFTDDNKWKFVNKYEYKYDEYGNQIYLLYSRNFDNSDTLIPRDLYTWEYLDDSRLSRMTIKYFYNNVYHVSRIGLYDYDENGRFIQYRNFMGLTDTVVDYAQVKYDAFGQVVLRTVGYLDGSDNIKNTYAMVWDDTGNLTEKIGTRLLNGEIKSNSLTKWTYDLKKNITSQSFESWMHDSANVIDGERIFITYDDSSNYLTKSYEAILNDKWTPIDRFTYTYDKQNQETSSIFENYYDGNWKKKNKTLREFDVQGDLLNINSFTWYTEQWLEVNANHDFHYNKQREYLEAYKIIVHYDITEIRETKPTEANINIIPNPSADCIRIMAKQPINQITITDLSGMGVMREKNYNSGDNIDISNLQVGFYMITVKTNENSYSRKFCKMK